MWTTGSEKIPSSSDRHVELPRCMKCRGTGTLRASWCLGDHEQLVLEDHAVLIEVRHIPGRDVTYVWDIPCHACIQGKLAAAPFTEVFRGERKNRGIAYVKEIK